MSLTSPRHHHQLSQGQPSTNYGRVKCVSSEFCSYSRMSRSRIHKEQQTGTKTRTRTWGLSSYAANTDTRPENGLTASFLEEPTFLKPIVFGWACSVRHSKRRPLKRPILFPATYQIWTVVWAPSVKPDYLNDESVCLQRIFGGLCRDRETLRCMLELHSVPLSLCDTPRLEHIELATKKKKAKPDLSDLG